ncbi:MAG: type I glyceraldehyde-3-phosphate dehydrogenase [Myxococcales bacterium]|nr:MAG: type I glyceraldehyde-3-phosphate dehydrogenase [Myxococcales bacterium]
MTVKVAINGFGRIGRVVLRQILKTKDVEVIGINDLTPVATSVHLLKYDSLHGPLAADIQSTDNSITVNGKQIPIYSTKDVAEVAQKFAKADVVMECTGKISGKEDLSKFIQAGAKFVILSRPAKKPEEVDGTFVIGVNHAIFDGQKHKVISNASCTTNCLAPVASVIHKKFGIEGGLMTTIHSYTNDQNVLDQGHKDLRRARAAALSMIPTTTGAARAVGLVIPELNGKLDGFAIRVPTPNVSVVDLTATLKTAVTAQTINAELRRASESELKGLLGYTDEPLVSSDFNGSTYSSVVDSSLTTVLGKEGKLVKVISWYDNETGYSTRMVDLARYVMTGKYAG